MLPLLCVHLGSDQGPPFYKNGALPLSYGRMPWQAGKNDAPRPLTPERSDGERGTTELQMHSIPIIYGKMLIRADYILISYWELIGQR